MASDPQLHIGAILEAIQHIEDDIAGLDFDAFRQDRKARQLVDRNLEIISEASRHIPAEAKARFPAIPWREIAGIGNVLRHDYHEVLPMILWETCRSTVPALKKAIAALSQQPAPR